MVIHKIRKDVTKCVQYTNNLDNWIAMVFPIILCTHISGKNLFCLLNNVALIVAICISRFHPIRFRDNQEMPEVTVDRAKMADR